MAKLEGDGEIILMDKQSRGEIDVQVATARRFPRSVKAFVDSAVELATYNDEVAEAMFYSLPRGGKKIEGPSIRLAEILASCWGHMRCEAKVVDNDGRWVTAKGVAWDMERGLLVAKEVRKRITRTVKNEDGTTREEPFSEDVANNLANAAASIALRNAILSVVPSAYAQMVMTAAKKTAMGQNKSLTERRQLALGWFAKAGASQAQVYTYLGVKGIEDLTIEHLEQLTGLRTAIMEGQTTIEAAMTFGVMVADASDLPVGKSKLGFGKKRPDGALTELTEAPAKSAESAEMPPVQP
jgi:hypothetical protein